MKKFHLIKIAIIILLFISSPSAGNAAQAEKTRIIFADSKVQIIHIGKYYSSEDADPYDQGELILRYKGKNHVLSSDIYYSLTKDTFAYLPKINAIVFSKYINPGRNKLMLYDYVKDKEIQLLCIEKKLGINNMDEFGYYNLMASPSGDSFIVMYSLLVGYGHLYFIDTKKYIENNDDSACISPDFENIDESAWQKNGTILIKNIKSSVSSDNEIQIAENWQWSPETGEKKIISITPPSPFADLKPGDPDYGIILKKYQDGTIKGDSNGNLNLDKVMTRKDMLESSYLFNIPAIPGYEKWPCTDLDVKDLLAPLFFLAFQRGLQLIDGNKCAPDEPMKRIEVVTIFFNGLELNPAKIDCQDRWPDYSGPMLPNAPYAALAKSNNLFGKDAEKLEPYKSMTKREYIKLEQKIVKDGINGYGASLAIPCDIDKYAEEYTWDPESPVTKILFRRKLMKWVAVGIGSALGLSGAVYGFIKLMNRGKK